MAYGLIPVRHAKGGVIRTNNFKRYFLANAYATALAVGDPVIPVSDGTVAIAVGTAGTPSPNIVGVIAGFEFVKSTGETVYDSYWPAAQATLGNALCRVDLWDDPDIIFKVQADQVGTALTVANVFNTFDLTAAAASATTKRSGWFLDSSQTGTTTSTAQVALLDSAEADRSYTSAGTAMDVEVKIIEHLWAQSPVYGGA